MRTFIAIELPKKIKDYLSDIQKKLVVSGADVKWVKPDNIHLTLKFLGEISPETLDQTNQTLEKICADKKAFCVNLSSVGVFPDIDRPKVVWIGINKGSPEISQIARELGKDSLSPHITLARVKTNKNLKVLAGLLKEFEEKPRMEVQEFTVSKITVFKSTLLPNGPIYEVLKEINLKAI